MNKLISGAVLILSLSFGIFPGSFAQEAPEVELSEIKESLWDHYQALPNLSTAYFSTRPSKRADGLEVGELANQRELIELAREIGEGKHTNYDSVLIAHKGKLVFESYFQRGRVNLAHGQASATKGYTSFAVGRAIQLGYLSMEDLHKPVLQFLKEVETTNLPAGIEKITLHHTLSMRSGLNLDQDKIDELLEKPELLSAQKLAQAYFAHSEPVTAETQIYHYQSADPQITMLVLDAVVPGGAKEFIQSELLNKLNITNVFWEDLVDGIPKAGSSSNLTSRDMLKWGLLLEQKGKWQGKQLIPENYLDLATSRVATPYDEDYDFSNFRYGYYFWGTQLNVSGKSYNLKLAWGGGGQYFIAVEELDLAIAITAYTRMQDDRTFPMLETRVLPIFDSINKAQKTESRTAK